MAFCNTKKMFEKALKEKYAVGAFNIYDVYSAKAVIDASEKTGKDIIVQVSEKTCDLLGAKVIADFVKALAFNTKNMVALHLDHGKSFESCKNAILAGFSSVMIDGSALPYEENVKLTKKVCDFAHKNNVSVEGELGQIGGVEDNVSASVNLTDPRAVFDFVNRTGVDSLAIAVGTAHGVNKGVKIPVIHYDIIEEVSAMLPNFPLVCHGASTVEKTLVDKLINFGGEVKKAQGIDILDLKKMADTNICKINMDSDLRLVYTASVREMLKNNPYEIDPRNILAFAENELSKHIQKVILEILVGQK